MLSKSRFRPIFFPMIFLWFCYLVATAWFCQQAHLCLLAMRCHSLGLSRNSALLGSHVLLRTVMACQTHESHAASGFVSRLMLQSHDECHYPKIIEKLQKIWNDLTPLYNYWKSHRKHRKYWITRKSWIIKTQKIQKIQKIQKTQQILNH